jgi:hypothetical protein
VKFDFKIVAEPSTNRWSYPEDIKSTGTSWPPESDKRVDSLLEDLNQTIERAPKRKGKTNLTHHEVAGLRWCKEKVKSQSLYITRADKGGSMYIFDAETVRSIILL